MLLSEHYFCISVLNFQQAYLEIQVYGFTYISKQDPSKSLFGNLGEALLLNFQTACLEIWLFGNPGVVWRTDRQMDRQTDGWMDRKMYEQTDRWMDWLADNQMKVWLERRMDRLMDRRTYGQ